MTSFSEAVAVGGRIEYEYECNFCNILGFMGENMTTEDYNNLCASVMKIKDDFDAQFAKIEADLLRIADGNILQERADEAIRAILPGYPVRKP